MPSLVTNRGKFNILGIVFRNGTEPTTFKLMLMTNNTPPTADTNLVSDVSEIAAGNGYTSGGLTVNRDSTDFDVLTEDDTNDRALVQLKDFSWTASGGNLPASGNGARWADLTDDNATIANREVYIAWDLASDRVVSDTQQLILQNCELRAV